MIARPEKRTLSTPRGGHGSAVQIFGVRQRAMARAIKHAAVPYAGEFGTYHTALVHGKRFLNLLRVRVRGRVRVRVRVRVRIRIRIRIRFSCLDLHSLFNEVVFGGMGAWWI